MVLRPICCHTGIPCRRHRSKLHNQSQYTDTGPTCRCAIHLCGTSHWNTQLPILMSWVRPDQEILTRPSTHTSECDAVMVVVESLSYPPGHEPGTCDVRIHYAIRSPTAASALWKIVTLNEHNIILKCKSCLLKTSWMYIWTTNDIPFLPRCYIHTCQKYCNMLNWVIFLIYDLSILKHWFWFKGSVTVGYIFVYRRLSAYLQIFNKV